MVDRAYEKYAWIILLAIGLVILVLAVLIIALPGGENDPDFVPVAGTTWDDFLASNPGGASYAIFAVQGFGILGSAVGVFAIAISLSSYRAGEKWAWYALWYLPVLFILLIASGLSAGSVTWTLWLILIVAGLFGLLLPYRKFFPKS